jgi:hypothetical protein
VKTAQEVRNAAADLIERYGWVTGRFGNIHIGFCLMGAILSVQGVTEVEITQAVDSVRSSMELPQGLVEYNDAPSRTKAEVLALLGNHEP